MTDTLKPLITLREAKVQCRLEVEATEDETGGNHPDNTYLNHLVSAALIAFEIKTNRKLFLEGDLPENAPDNALVINALIKQGTLMLISHWYENRETVTVGTAASKVPLSFEFVYEPYRFFSL